MKITTKRRFHATPRDLWQIIHDPSNMPAYNPKCVMAESPHRHEVGQRFSVSYEMNGKRTSATGEIVSLDREKRIQFRYHYQIESGTGIVDETFAIVPDGKGSTLLTHTVDFSKSHLPKWVKILIGLLGRFGKSMGNGPLDGIAELLS